MRFYFYHTPQWLKKIYPQATWTRNSSKNEIFLTFDDGPVPGATETVLKILDQYKATATFFVVGDNVKKYPELLKEVASQGHAVGNHTYHHRSGWSIGDQHYFSEVDRCEKIIEETLGQSSKLFRPPYGRIKFSQVNKLSNEYELIMWEILSGDFDLNLNFQSSLKALNKAKSGDILVFHDSNKYIKNVEYLLPRVLDHLSEKNFTFSNLTK